MKAYPKYKDSGIQWLGQIPEHWETLRAKYMFVKNKRERRPEDEVITCFRDGQVTLRKNRRITGFTESEKYDGYQGVRKGDLVIHQMDAFAGSIGVSDSDGMGTSVYHCCTPTGDYNVYYYAYLLRHMALSGYIQSLYKGIRERSSDFSFPIFGRQFLAVPPLNEQEKIVEFIDRRTQKIDAYVAERERGLQILSELQQAEIAAAVTRGLNPNVPMKDSGISWVGQIPEHWEVSRMKKLFSEAKEKTTNENGTLLSLSQYTGITLKSEAGKTGMFEAESTVGYNIVHSGQFVMNIMLAWNGSYAVSDFDGIISPSYAVFNFNIDCEKKYFDYLLRLQAYAGAFKTMSKGIIESRLRLYPVYFLAFPVIIPPLSEQRAIVDYIDRKCSNINSLISEIEAEITYLKEYKQRMIADAVTGAINVQ